MYHCWRHPAKRIPGTKGWQSTASPPRLQHQHPPAPSYESLSLGLLLLLQLGLPLFPQHLSLRLSNIYRLHIHNGIHLARCQLFKTSHGNICPSWHQHMLRGNNEIFRQRLQLHHLLGHHIPHSHNRAFNFATNIDGEDKIYIK